MLVIVIRAITQSIKDLKDVSPEMITAFGTSVGIILTALIGIMLAATIMEKFGGGATTSIKGAVGIAAAFAIVVGIVGAVLVGLGSLEQLGDGNFLTSRIEHGGAVLKSIANALNIFDDPMTTVEAMVAALGMRGDEVREMQEWLQQAGYDLGKAGVDGIFGPDTEAALKKFQEETGQVVTGIYSEHT